MNELVAGYTRDEFELLRKDAKAKFDQDRKNDWLEWLLWTTPHRAKHLLGLKNQDKVGGYPILDGTHILSHRSFVAGFLEGNTSASRPWMRYQHPDPDRNRFLPNREYLDLATSRVQSYLSNSNFYHQAGQFYYDFGAVNTGCHIFKKFSNGLHVYTLMPGSYFPIVDALNEPVVVIREFSCHAMALVNRYGTRKDGKWDWSKFSLMVRNLFEKSDTTVMIECVEIFCKNKNLNINEPIGGTSRQWVNVTYETGQSFGNGFAAQGFIPQPKDATYLEIGYSTRRPFIAGKSHGDGPYGEMGPTTSAINLIRSANKKAISKDIALEKMLDPTTQGPAHIRKSYLTTQARKHIPLDATAMAQGGLRTVFEVNPAIGALAADVQDVRSQIEKFYYADFLLYLTNNPKTRTAEEVREIVTEKQSVIGPNLQTLNWSYNAPIAEYMLDFILHEDPYMPPPPDDLQGEAIGVEFTSVFAQVQKAFDLPQINEYVQRWMNIAQLNPAAWDNINLDILAKTYEDRFYLPAGLNNPQSKVDAMREQAARQQQQQQMIDAIPAAAGASLDGAKAQQIQQQMMQGEG